MCCVAWNVQREREKRATPVFVVSPWLLLSSEREKDKMTYVLASCICAVISLRSCCCLASFKRSIRLNPSERESKMLLSCTSCANGGICAFDGCPAFMAVRWKSD